MNTVKKAPTKKVAKKIVTIEKPKPLPLSGVTYDYSTRIMTIKFPNSKYNYTIRVENSPTDNCQLYCVANFAGLLAQIRSSAYNIPVEERKSQLEHILYNFSNCIGKALMLIDIHEDLIETFKDLIDISNIVLEQHYTSSNNSNMYIFIIRTDRDEFSSDED